MGPRRETVADLTVSTWLAGTASNYLQEYANIPFLSIRPH